MDGWMNGWVEDKEEDLRTRRRRWATTTATRTNVRRAKASSVFGSEYPVVQVFEKTHGI